MRKFDALVTYSTPVCLIYLKEKTDEESLMNIAYTVEICKDFYCYSGAEGLCN